VRCRFCTAFHDLFRANLPFEHKHSLRPWPFFCVDVTSCPVPLFASVSLNGGPDSFVPVARRWCRIAFPDCTFSTSRTQPLMTGVFLCSPTCSRPHAGFPCGPSRFWSLLSGHTASERRPSSSSPRGCPNLCFTFVLFAFLENCLTDEVFCPLAYGLSLRMSCLPPTLPCSLKVDCLNPPSSLAKIWAVMPRVCPFLRVILPSAAAQSPERFSTVFPG